MGGSGSSGARSQDGACATSRSGSARHLTPTHTHTRVPSPPPTPPPDDGAGHHHRHHRRSYVPGWCLRDPLHHEGGRPGGGHPRARLGGGVGCHCPRPLCHPRVRRPGVRRGARHRGRPARVRRLLRRRRQAAGRAGVWVRVCAWVGVFGRVGREGGSEREGEAGRERAGPGARHLPPSPTCRGLGPPARPSLSLPPLRSSTSWLLAPG